MDEEEEEEEEEEEDTPNPTTQDPMDREANSLLAVGYKHNRSFVVRGNKIGVFKHDNGTTLSLSLSYHYIDQLEFSTAIKNIADLSGQVFSPRKVMLHQEDSKMMLMHPTDTQKLHVMDLEYGKVPPISH